MAIILSLVLSSNAFGQAAKDTVRAKVNDSMVTLNLKTTPFESYNIAGNNYFKLRDVAKSVSGTDKQFNVVWNEKLKAIEIVSNKPYKEISGELAKGDGKDKIGTLNTSKIYKDGKEIQLLGYNINSNNYFKLRDIGKALDIGVTWNSLTQSIGINTKAGYEEEKPVEKIDKSNVDRANFNKLKDLTGVWASIDHTGKEVYLDFELPNGVTYAFLMGSSPVSEEVATIHTSKIEEAQGNIKIEGHIEGTEAERPIKVNAVINIKRVDKNKITLTINDKFSHNFVYECDTILEYMINTENKQKQPRTIFEETITKEAQQKNQVLKDIENQVWVRKINQGYKEGYALSFTGSEVEYRPYQSKIDFTQPYIVTLMEGNKVEIFIQDDESALMELKDNGKRLDIKFGRGLTTHIYLRADEWEKVKKEGKP